MLLYANNKLKITTKNIVMSFKPYTEKIKKKKIGICSILGRIRIWIHHPGSGSASKRYGSETLNSTICLHIILIRFVIDLFFGPAFHVRVFLCLRSVYNFLLLFHMFLLKLHCFSPESKVDARKERERDTLCPWGSDKTTAVTCYHIDSQIVTNDNFSL